MRNVLDDQRPIFLMQLSDKPLRLRLIAPPARRLWLATKEECRPCRSSLRLTTASFTALVIFDPVIDFIVRPCSKNDPNIMFSSAVCVLICLTRLMIALIGQNSE